MKRIQSILLVLLILLTSLAACSETPVEDIENDGQQVEDQGGEQEKEEVEEVFDGTLRIVLDGVSDYVIVRGENAYVSEITAATELQSYLKQISGAELPIVTDSTAPVAKEIVVGKTNRESEGQFNREELGDEGFVIISDEHKIFLVGGELRGTLYSVYSFLEEYLGIRYYYSNVEKVPQMSTVTLEAIAENKQIPVFEARLSDTYPRDYKWNVKQKINENTYASVPVEFGGGVAFPAQDHSGGFVHSMQSFVNYHTYFESHPEYFARDINGEYILNDPLSWTQCCMTNSDVLQLTIDGVRKILSEKPYVNYVSVSQNDGYGVCRCDNCLKIELEEGAYSGVVLRFVNAVADAIKDEYPNVTIETLAYQPTIDVPTITKPADNVVVRLAPIEQCMIHSTEECQTWFTSPDTGKSTYQILKEWAEVGCELFIWDYSTNFGARSLVWPALYSLREDVRLYADSNVTGIFFQGNGDSYSGNFEELRIYLLSKLYWDPYMSDEEFEYHINDFLQGFYGEGWEHIRAFIDETLSLVTDTHSKMNIEFRDMFDSSVVTHDDRPVPEELTVESFTSPETVDWSVYYGYYSELNPELYEYLERSFERFEAAEALAKNEEELDRILRSKIQLLDLEIYYLLKVPIRSNLMQLYNRFFKDWETEVPVTSAEFTQFVNSICYTEIIEKNSQLFDIMLKYYVGSGTGYSNLHEPKENANFKKAPQSWY